MLRRLVAGSMLTAAAAWGATTPALADVAGEYAGADERESLIEVAGNGDRRMSGGEGGGYLLIVGSKAYSVEPRSGRPARYSYRGPWLQDATGDRSARDRHLHHRE